MSTTEILNRANLKVDLFTLVEKVSNHYKLGPISSFAPIEVGYEDLNIKLRAGNGAYVIKVFSKGKSYRVVKSYVRGLVEFAKVEIPCPEVLESKNGLVYKFTESSSSAYLCVTIFFRGQSFSAQKITGADLVKLTRYISRIHQASFPITKAYDSWGTINLLREFDKKYSCLAKRDFDLVYPVVQAFSKLPFAKFTKSIVHGDLQKSNILKNSNGGYCILDLGCLDYNYSILDLAIFLSQFGYGNSLVKNKKIYKIVINEYMQSRELNEFELTALPDLIRATYAIYLISANYAIQSGDTSSQTLNWLKRSRRGLALYQY